MKNSLYIESSKKELNSLIDGYFSILLVGERGTGKTSLTKEIPNSTFISCEEENGLFEVFFNNLMDKKADSENKSELKIVIFDSFEKLSKEYQKRLHNLLSTGPENLLVNIRGDKKKYCPQLIFSTNFEYSQLFDETKFYLPLIDRISQQIIELKSIRKYSFDDIKNAWETVNINMLLSNENSKYENILKDFELTIVNFINKKLSLFGNYRDLQKLCIYLWRYSKSKKETINETELIRGLEDFQNLYERESKSEFFKNDVTADEMIKEYRKSMVEWAENKYSNLSRADIIGKLKISEKTYYNWKNGV
jgi:transcriptional regulator with PAS, ATPase and Fis domain